MATTAQKRQTYKLPGLTISDMAPDLVKAGNLFFTSGIRGTDRNTGKLGETPEEQFRLAWQNLKALVEHAGLSTDEIGRMIRSVTPEGWSGHPNLWIVAVDYATGRRVVFGSADAPPTPERAPAAYPTITRQGHEHDTPLRRGLEGG
jgi:hypothetical protein